jgi:hypothetical protein
MAERVDAARRTCTPGVAQGGGDRAAHGAGLRQALRELVDVDYPDARCIRVVQDKATCREPVRCPSCKREREFRA